jgi:hypothetical protein
LFSTAIGAAAAIFGGMLASRSQTKREREARLLEARSRRIDVELDDLRRAEEALMSYTKLGERVQIERLAASEPDKPWPTVYDTPSGREAVDARYDASLASERILDDDTRQKCKALFAAIAIEARSDTYRESSRLAEDVRSALPEALQALGARRRVLTAQLVDLEESRNGPRRSRGRSGLRQRGEP